MFKLLIQELKDLTRPLDFISPEYARIAVKAVIDKLASKTDAHIVDVYWKETAKGGYVLKPFVCIRTDATQPSMIIVNEEKGILPWVFKNGLSAWIDDVKAKDWSQPVLNLSAVDTLKERQKYGDSVQDDNEEQAKVIQPSHKIDSFSGSTDAIIAVPLIHRNIIWGVFSLEYKKTKQYDHDLLIQLLNISRYLACLIWKSDIQVQNNGETREAVEGFVNTISKAEVEMVPFTSHPSYFFSRQFDEAGRFEEIERKVQKIISEVNVEPYRPRGKDLVVDEIIDGIKRSHFCFADITGQNPNVMLELGMMMMYKKDIIILRSFDDDSPIPFNINQNNIYFYKCEKEELLVRKTGGSRFKSFKPQLKELAEMYIKQ